MTGRDARPRRFLALLGMTRGGTVLLSPRPVVSCLRGNDGNGCGNDGVAGLRGGDVRFINVC